MNRAKSGHAFVVPSILAGKRPRPKCWRIAQLDRPHTASVAEVEV